MAERFCPYLMVNLSKRSKKMSNFSSLLNILGVDKDDQLNFKCCNPASVLRDINLNSLFLLFGRHFFAINRLTLNDEGAV